MCIAHSFRAFAHNDLKMEKIAFVDTKMLIITQPLRQSKYCTKIALFLTLFQNIVHSFMPLTVQVFSFVLYTEECNCHFTFQSGNIFFGEYYYSKVILMLSYYFHKFQMHCVVTYIFHTFISSYIVNHLKSICDCVTTTQFIRN